MASVPASSSSVGRTLSEARRRRRVSFSRIVQATRIPLQYVRALEQDAPPEAFPAPVYARFFLHEYAEFLGLDPGPLVELFDARHGVAEEERPILQPVQQMKRVPLLPSWSSRAATVAAVLGALGLAAVGIVSGSRHSPEANSAPRQAARVISPGPQASAERLRTSPAHRSGIRAVLRVRERCWVRATVDGRVVLSESLEPGRTKWFSADRKLELRLGNAGGVELTVNGKPVRTAGRGNVIQLSFAWRHGRLVTS